MALTPKERKQRQIKLRQASLHVRTNLFWQIHLAYRCNTGPMQGITTEFAVTYLYDLIEASPEKVLHERLWQLRDNIVGVKTRTAKSCTARQYEGNGGDDDGPRAA